jgi:hypothetical protein
MSEKPKQNIFNKLNPVIPGTGKIGIGRLITGLTRAEQINKIQKAHEDKIQDEKIKERKARTPSFLEQLPIYEDENHYNYNLTKEKKIHSAINAVNEEVNSDDEKYFPEDKTAENLDIIKNNLTTHLMFHITSQSGIGGINDMKNLIIHDLHYANLLGGFEDNQKRKLSILAGLKLNKLANELRNSPSLIIEDFAPNIVGDYLLFVNLLGVKEIPADQQNHIKNFTKNDSTFMERAITRLREYDNDKVMTQFLSGFSEPDQALIREKRTGILEYHKNKIEEAVGYLQNLQQKLS